ncbi:MAG: cytochrome c oxidase accessory protein CcoG [Rhodospirillaceae bacterium]|jgi:cytochrome c oxidase accessory protein FixG|nr:cytochrome c oxidase accessory protein CcoG [Rhodospirillaceae bacterium]
MNQPITDSAPVVETVDVEPVNKPEQRAQYEKRRKIHPRRVHGPFRRLKWISMAMMLAIYYLSPWIRWDRGPTAPDQAILVDMSAPRFYFFFIEIWPQEIYYVTGLLIIAALMLFLATSLLGRVWCGYACPQTVWTDLFVTVERFVEGDRAARIRLDRAPLSLSKIGKRGLKHFIWLVIGACTGGAWVFYFVDAPTLAAQLLTFDAPAAVYGFVGLLTGTTYLLGGIAREQVCTFMCPWPRIQAAMFDEDTLLVGYREFRGEPRAPYRKGDSFENRGSCIDCNSCVVVCPAGIDIRDGLQLECISCALCIDACNNVMDRIDQPRGLIGYDTVAGLRRKADSEVGRPRIIRARTVIYAGLIALVGGIMLVTLLGRSPLDVNVLRDRNPLFVKLSDGGIRNGYTVKILNKHHEIRTFDLKLSGVKPAAISIIGTTGTRVTVGPDRLRSFRVFVKTPRAALTSDSTPIRFHVKDREDDRMASHDSTLRGPGR